MINISSQSQLHKSHQEWQKGKLKVKNQQVEDDGTQSFFW